MQRRYFVVIALVAVFAVAAVVLFLPKVIAVRGQTEVGSAVVETEPAVVAENVESKMLIFGDIYWGRGVNQKAQASSLKEAYPFSRLSEFGRENYDAWIGNLECPSVPGVNQSYSVEVSSLLFNCSSTYLPEFAKWFDVVSLANNHTSNQGGQSGLDATRQALDSNGIQYFAHYNPNITEDVCEVVALPARLTMSDDSVQQVNIPVAMCGYHGLSATPSAESLAQITKYSEYMPVIAFTHMGTEYKSTIDSARQALYRSMIDNGADVVMGGHPHWVQPTEVYNGKLIFYSLGNFLFDQWEGETSRGAAISLTLSSKDSVSSELLEQWTALGEACAVYKDSCLARAQAQNLQAIDYTFSFTAQGVDMSGLATHPADASINGAVLERLNWQDISY